METPKVRPPAKRARQVALVLSAIGVAFSLGFGFCVRRSWAFQLLDTYEGAMWLMAALVLLLVALLLRMAASICELMWLERAWTSLPESLRNWGKMKNVHSAHVVAFSFIPVFSYFWKLGLVSNMADGFEGMRRDLPFQAPVPKRLGMAAVIIGWVPGLNVYFAPFLWEMFASRMEAVMGELIAASDARST